jgi:hypothetical protein
MWKFYNIFRQFLHKNATILKYITFIPAGNEVLTVVTTNSMIFRVVTPFSWQKSTNVPLKSVDFYQTTWHCSPKDCSLEIHTYSKEQTSETGVTWFVSTSTRKIVSPQLEML